MVNVCKMLGLLMLHLALAAAEYNALLQAASEGLGHVGPKRIPCLVHQLWKAQNGQQQNTLKLKNPTCEFQFWNDTEMETFCRTTSQNQIWPIWDRLAHAEKASVFGYLVLWDQGGYFADINVESVIPIDTDHLATFVDRKGLVRHVLCCHIQS
ncbi:unnamed protein product [Durusdinium trenchii]|uniref:Uncharacterized protein n=1 Tax=Durusdinium trenchii TaxID=1381693 RepID=A0ABP0SFU9_9DINO